MRNVQYRIYSKTKQYGTVVQYGNIYCIIHLVFIIVLRARPGGSTLLGPYHSATASRLIPVTALPYLALVCGHR